MHALLPASSALSALVCAPPRHWTSARGDVAYAADTADAAEIRRRYGDDSAVIMIASNEQHEMVEGCIRVGADSSLFKPFSPY